MPGLISEPATTPLTPGEYLEKALAWSKEVQSKVKCELDIAYGPDERQKLDVYPPEPSGTTPVPVLMFMHGGYWVVGHKDTLGFMAPRRPSLVRPPSWSRQATGWPPASNTQYRWMTAGPR